MEEEVQQIGFSWSSEIIAAEIPGVLSCMYDADDNFIGKLEGIFHGKLN